MKLSPLSGSLNAAQKINNVPGAVSIQKLGNHASTGMSQYSYFIVSLNQTQSNSMK